MIAIIGGETRRFRPLAEIHREYERPPEHPRAGEGFRRAADTHPNCECQPKIEAFNFMRKGIVSGRIVAGESFMATV